VARDRGLPHALAGADHGERRLRVRSKADRVEPEVRAHVREPARERCRGEPKAAPRIDHRLVREIDDEIHVDRGQRLRQRVPERDAVVRDAAAQLLGPAEENDADHVVT
jgi:hypothetical protein